MTCPLCASILLLCLACVTRVSGRIAGAYGGLCVNECRLYKGFLKSYYFCKTTSHSWDYCSPVAGTGAGNSVCKANSLCGKHGASYSWCYTENGSWDYCSDHVSDIIGSYGGVCLDTCRNDKDTPFSFCKTTKHSWDYCSLKPQTGVHGTKCKPHHPCGNHGWWYSWCNTDDGRWDYCSVHPSDFTTSLTRRGYHCTSQCHLHDTHHSYHFCYDYENWDYCSPKPHSTYRKVGCRPDHFCDNHGLDYYWCYIGKDDAWDYCSPIMNCAYWPVHSWLQISHDEHDHSRKRKKRKTHSTCHIKGNPHNISYTYKIENCNRLVQANPQQQKEGEILIGKWELHSVKGGQQAETLYTTDNLRIDMKETPIVGLATLLMQTKHPACDNLASVMIPTGENFPLRHIRRAFSESLNRTVEITLKNLPIYRSAAGPSCSSHYAILTVLITYFISLWRHL